MEILKTRYGNFPVYVNPIAAGEGILLHISFVDKQNKTHIVIMHQVSQQWLFKEPEIIPVWISEQKDQLDKLILINNVRELQHISSIGLK